MRDQAEKLRLKMLERQGALGRAIAVVNGKGGVGKSNFTTNFAINLAKLGKKVVILDMDLGMANVHILIGKQGRHHLRDYLEGTVSLEEILYQGPYNIHYISGGSGFTSVVEWSEEMFEAFVYGFGQLQKKYDFILFDMGAGATNWSLDVLTSIDEIIVITTCEPTSITDAYSMMKFILLKEPNKTFLSFMQPCLYKRRGKGNAGAVEKNYDQIFIKRGGNPGMAARRRNGAQGSN
ncbi:P-loop NTPase [Ureibacillus terrenus]|uniref:P-loop NTPase n=1 Tax=Ureibacillus terrenus TaxID=118246 RepID=UPI002E2369CE|nr:P-loop NTPase [Ureibacillus terrenus]